MTTLTLPAVSIVVPPERVSYNSLRLKYQQLAEAAAATFAANFAVMFTNMDDIHSKCTDQFIAMLRETAEIAVQDIVAHGIYDIDLELFGDYMGNHVTWDEDFAVIDDKYMGIVLKADELAPIARSVENRGGGG